MILRDGTTAAIRPTRTEDQRAVAAFFDRLSPDSRRRRFFSLAPPGPELSEKLCDSADPGNRLTLAVFRNLAGANCIIAAGSYLARDERSAEVAVAVADDFQGRGLGTLLLERLALLAVRNGLTRFWAVVQADNQRMLEVLEKSGFPLREKADDGFIEINLSVEPTETSVTRSETRDRVSTVASLQPFFRPRSVAVVGASRDPANIGHRILRSLVDRRFRGAVYAVNPNARAIGAIPCYPSVSAAPQPVDLAVIAVPRGQVFSVVDDCASRDVKALVVITAGFAETSGEGRSLQERLVERVRGYGMRMLGPNCLGLINTDPTVRLNASFSPVVPPRGRVAMSSQSGALGLAIIALARQRRLGLSTFVSVGNKADISGNDLLQYWEEDESTNVILLYLESFGNPRRFSRIVRRVSRTKPIVVMKAGRTAAGRRAAGSHTAALASSEVAVEALFRQTGVIRAETLDEMFDLAAFLGSQPLPRRIPSYPFPEEAGRVLSKAAAYAEWRDQPEGLIPDFEDIDAASARAVCQKAVEQRGPVWLTAEEIRQVLSAFNLPTLAGGLAKTAEEAVDLARTVGYPAVVKLASRQIVHKTEIDGVRLNLADDDQVKRAFHEIRERLVKENRLEAMDGVLVQPMLSAGVELMVGVAEDPLFGPLIAFGLGGIHVEILGDVCFRVTPLTERDIREMIQGTRGYRLLKGYRGHPSADIAALEELLLRVSRMVEEIPEIADLDLNPVFSLAPGEGCRIADVRVRVAPAARPRPATPLASHV